jgi:hypothetical protein
MPSLNRHAVEVGVLLAVGNFLIFSHFMPPVTDVKAAEQFNPLVESSERTALLVSTAFSGLVAGGIKSWDTFLIAGSAIIVIDFAYKHANAVHPDTGTMTAPGGEMMDTGSLHPLPNYEDSSSDTG